MQDRAMDEGRLLMSAKGLCLTDAATAERLVLYARQYENEAFLDGDPSWFMHQVSGRADREAMAFIASALSYGSRRQFMPKIGNILRWSEGCADSWVRCGRFEKHFPYGDSRCYYRLYTVSTMHVFLSAYRSLLLEHGTLGDYVRSRATDGIGAVTAICDYFGSHGVKTVIPKDTRSACKRVCMFLRWMVRSGSPVDLGLWADFIDRRTLIIPLDTHVVGEAMHLGLLESRCTSMQAAQRLTERLAQVFPDDPLLGDFALFGYGVNRSG